MIRDFGSMLAVGAVIVFISSILLISGVVYLRERTRIGDMGRIKLIDVENKDALKKINKSQFIADSNALASVSKATGTIKQGAIEDSAADEVSMLMRMTNAARDVETNAGLITAQDRLMDRAINTLGRVA